MSSRYLEHSPFASDRGEKIGKVPRKIPMQDLNDLDHPRTPLTALRATCLQCCQGSKGEVRKCVVYKCPAWPMRMGHNPFHGQSPITQKKTPDAFDGRSEAFEISRQKETQNDR
jgi:hypothetical protein